MSTAEKKIYRKRRLFPRTMQEVVKDATKPLMSKQGKLYGALLRDWAQIVGAERAAATRPARLQFTKDDDSGAILHLDVRPAAAPEMAYMQEQLLEQCARYFGYRAISRIVLHATHGVFLQEAPIAVPTAQPRSTRPLPSNVPPEMRAAFERLAAHVASASDKKK